jgi:hypothetical protein
MTKEYAKRFPTDTAIEVYNPDNPPPAETDPISLHLDQTTPQRVINGTPHFDKGLIIRAGEKLIFDGD